MVRLRAAVILAAAALAGAVHSAAQENASQSAAPRFEDAPCPFKANENALAQIRCGYLTVPENRAHPERGQLKLAVAIARSVNATARPDPVVLLSGGPGQSIVSETPRLMNVMGVLRADRDVIIWDQRGTGFSEPAFCPELSARWREIQARRLAPSDRIKLQREAVADCRTRLLKQGVDLSQYNTVVTTHDLDDLRRALGVTQWNLMAVSYGTRVALEAMRPTPAGTRSIRSAVLTSPLPPNPPIDGREAFADVVRRISRACAAQPDCGAAYPEVERSLWAGMQELEAKPVVRRLPDGREQVTDGNRLLQAVREATRSRRSLALVPMIIGEFRRRNEAIIAALSRQMTGSVTSRVGRISRGLNLAVGCHDFRGTAEAQHSPTPDILDIGVFERDESICDALHTFRAGPQAPVVSDIPALLLTGEFDVVTHRSYGPAAARTLRNSQVVEAPGAGHGEGMGEECTRGIVRDFIANPLAKVDTNCLSTMTLRFVTDVRMIGQ